MEAISKVYCTNILLRVLYSVQYEPYTIVTMAMQTPLIAIDRAVEDALQAEVGEWVT